MKTTNYSRHQVTLLTIMVQTEKWLYKKHFVLFLLFALFHIDSIAQTPKKIISIEGMTEYRLDNGLQVILIPDQTQASTTVNIVYKVGSRHEGYGEKGMAHLLEHMLFKGSEKHLEIPKELSAHGCFSNGTTSHDRTNYFESFTSSEENLNWALELESDRMVNSFIREEDLKTEFSVVRNEFERNENYPFVVMMQSIFSSAYTWHNYGNAVLGSKEDIERVKATTLKQFYKKYYRPDNAVLIVAGKFNESNTINKIAKCFGPIKNPSEPLADTYSVEPTQEGERAFTIRRTGDVTLFNKGYHIPAATHPDYVLLEVAANIMTDKPTGRLYESLVNRKLASTCYGIPYRLKEPGFMYFAVDAPIGSSVDSINNAIEATIAQIKVRPISQEETERAISRLRLQNEMGFKKSETLALWLTQFVALGDWKLLFYMRDRLELATAIDVNRVIAEYWKKSNSTTGIFIAEKTPDRSIVPESPKEGTLTKYYKSSDFIISESTFDASPEAILSNSKQGQLSGGAKYILLPKPSRGESVSANLIINVGNKETLLNKSLQIDLYSKMLMKGSKKMSYTAIKDSLDKLKTRIFIYGEEQEIYVNINSDKKNINAALLLVNYLLRNPEFPENELDNVKNEDLTMYETYKNDPASLTYQMMNTLNNQYKPGDLRYNLSMQEKYDATKAIQRIDLVNFHQEFMNYDSLSLSVVGDFETESLVKTIENNFNNYSSKHKYIFPDYLPQKVLSGTKITKTPDKKSASLLFRKNLDVTEYTEDYPALFMADYLFGGGFINSRLATRLRQDEGLCYSVGSYLDIDLVGNESHHAIYASFNPDNKDKVVNAIHQEMDSLLKYGINEKELHEAQSGIAQQSKLERSQEGFLSYHLALYSSISKSILWDSKFEKDLSQLNIEQVNLALKKYLSLQGFAEVLAGDFK